MMISSKVEVVNLNEVIYCDCCIFSLGTYKREERKDDSARRNDNDGGMMFSLVGHLMHIEQRLPDPTSDPITDQSLHLVCRGI